MPIEVRHDIPDLSNLAALAGLVGIGQQKLPEYHPTPTPHWWTPQADGGGGGRRGGGSRAGTVWGGGESVGERYQRQYAESPEGKAEAAALMLEKTMPYELERKRKEAEIERQNWEFQYDMQGKKRIAELNKARQYITQSGQFSPQEQTALLPLLDMQIANVPKAVIEKSEMTKQLEALGPEKQPGRLWKGDDGSSYQTIIGTSGLPEPKLMLRQDQTTEHHLAIAEAANQAKVVATQARYLDARRSAMITWTKEKVPVTKPAVGGGWFGYGAEEGGPTGEERLRTPEEVEALADRFFPLGQPQQPQEQRVTREAPGAPALRPPKWVADALSKGSIKLTEEERKSVEGAPREILEALVYIKAALDKWPNPKDMPPSVVQEMMAAQRLIDMLPQ